MGNFVGANAHGFPRRGPILAHCHHPREQHLIGGLRRTRSYWGAMPGGDDEDHVLLHIARWRSSFWLMFLRWGIAKPCAA